MAPSIDHIVQEYKTSIFKICYGYAKTLPDTEDLVQEVFINIWKGLKSFKNKSNIKTWVYRITVNTCLLGMRKKRVHTIPFSSLDIHLHSVDNQKNENENIHRLRDLIHKLPEQQRIITLLYLEGLSHKEIASTIGITSNYVGVKLNRIKHHLSNKINSNG